MNDLIMKHLRAWSGEEPLLRAYILAGQLAATGEVLQQQNASLQARVQELEAGNVTRIEETNDDDNGAA